MLSTSRLPLNPLLLVTGRRNSAFAPLTLTTLTQFSISEAMIDSKAAEEPDSAAPPISARRDLTSGSARVALTARLSVSTMGVGALPT